MSGVPVPQAGAPVAEGDLLWTPDAGRIETANLTRFVRWLADTRGLEFADYAALWRWSVTDLEGFWQAVWDHFEVAASTPPERVLRRREMPGAQWFPGARLNYAENVLRGELRARGGAAPGSPAEADPVALVAGTESAPLTTITWPELAAQVRLVATRLRELGVRPGDRVAGWLPNVPEAVVAMLATTAVGAVWATCSPDFGSRGTLDRLAQLEPVVLFAVDGYRYGDRWFDRREERRAIVDGLPTLRHVIDLPDGWAALLDHPPVPAADFAFEQVPFDHPLWVLFSSGTTGLPKALVHGHGGIVLEQQKLQAFHLDVHPGDRSFFFTTTGWMMWNSLVSAMLLGAVPVLYDGSPVHPDAAQLWRLAQDARATVLAASPSYVDLVTRAGVVPGERFDLGALRTVMPAGSPVSPEHTEWFYRNVKPDLWVATGSGGTDCCTGFVGGVPTLPVYAGEMQARSLGVAAEAFDVEGRPVVSEVGELVITQPLPSMPVRLWGDDDGSRYRGTYFADYPGVWRHGDLFRVNERGGCFVLGRSDATLNRHGVRIGTAEIYRALAGVPEVVDALVVNLNLPGGGFFMPLFVTLAPGARLDDDLAARIRDRLRQEYTPRHVPDRIVEVPAIPVTRTGKKLEVPVRKILLGAPPERAANREALADPAALDPILAYARTQRDYDV